MLNNLQCFSSISHLFPQMCILSRQVTAVSQELQEMTRLLKPLFHNSSTLLMPCTVTPPPSVSPRCCSPGPTVLTQQAPADPPDRRNEADLHSPQLDMGAEFQGQFDPLRCSLTISPPPTSQQIHPAPPLSHRSAPPSLNSSPHEHAAVLHPCLSTSIPSLPLVTTPLLVDLSEPGTKLQTLTLPAASHSHIQPFFQTSSMATTNSQMPILNLHDVQLSFVDEGRPSV